MRTDASCGEGRARSTLRLAKKTVDESRSFVRAYCKLYLQQGGEWGEIQEAIARGPAAATRQDPVAEAGLVAFLS